MGAVMWIAAVMTSGVAAGLIIPSAARAVRTAGARLEARARLAPPAIRNGGRDGQGSSGGVDRRQIGAAAMASAALRGVPGSDSPAMRRIAASRVLGVPCRAVCRELSRLRVPHQQAAVWCCMAMAGAIPGAAVGFASGSWLAGLITALAIPWAFIPWLRRKADTRASVLAEQVPDALRTIDAALTAGLGVGRAIAYAARSTPDPLGAELGQVVWEVRAGRSLEEALERLRTRVGVSELELVVVALEVQHKSGGSLHAILESAIEVASQSHELERSLRVKTAQARLSARVVGVMPIVLVAALSLVSPGYLAGFIQEPAGVAMLAAALLLEVCGLLAIRSIMHVEV